MRREIKGFGTIAPEILSEICEDPTYARLTLYLERKSGQGVNLILTSGIMDPLYRYPYTVVMETGRPGILF